MNFENLISLESVLRVIKEIGYENPTEIQEKAIPLIKTGVDVIGKSQTGTGKTMAFAIPMVEMIDTKEDKRTVQSLVMCPTRELAMQVAEEIQKLTKYTEGVKIATVYGGAPMNAQIQNLKKANVVIGTPGRIEDHLRRKTLKLKNLKSVILDEADEMLSMGFKDDIKAILNEAPDDIQTILFSATMPKAIVDITEEFQDNPVTIEVARKDTTSQNITQRYVEVQNGRKMDVLKMFLHTYLDGISIIFCNTKKMVDEVEQTLNRSGFKALGLHGDMKQEQRTKVMNAYKAGAASILVATDVAARGIDVDDVSLVVNYDVPQNSEYYVHRIGRTGRAGKSGTAITILGGKRGYYDLRDLQKDLKITIDKMPIPSLEDIKELKNEKNAADIIAKISEDSQDKASYEKMYDKVIAEGHSERDVAIALMAMHFGVSDKSLNQIETIKENFNNNDFDRVKFDIGRNQRVAPNHLVSAIATECNIKGATIGKIEIFEKFSIVAVLKKDIQTVVSKMQDVNINGYDVTCVIDTKRPSSGGGNRGRSGGNGGNFQKRRQGDSRSNNFRPRGPKKD